MTTTVATPSTVDTPAKAGRWRAREGTGQANWFVKLVIVLLCFFWMLPAVGILVTSFRTLDDAQATGWWSALNPANWGHFTFSNYTDAIKNANFGTDFFNSIAITLPAVFIPILIAAFAAYAFTFMKFPGKDVLFVIIVGLLVVPNYVSFVPILKLYSQYKLAGTFPSVWLAHIGFGMSLAIYLLRNYMSTLPREVIESAKIDGASHYQTFFRLILPMSTPALASFAIFQFLWVWNDLLVALVFIGPGENEPVTVGMTHLLGQQGQGWNLVTAAGLVSMIVPVIVFLSLQRYFVRGLTAGSVKG
jgi:alpha-glucoside transport system permease protein